MKRCILFLKLLCFSLLLGISSIAMAQNSEVNTLVDPLTVSGTVGTQITSSWNNADLHYTSPFSAIAYANTPHGKQPCQPHPQSRDFA